MSESGAIIRGTRVHNALLLLLLSPLGGWAMKFAIVSVYQPVCLSACLYWCVNENGKAEENGNGGRKWVLFSGETPQN